MRIMILLLGLLLSADTLCAQELYLNGRFRKKSYANNNNKYTLYDFDMGDGVVKAKFFAQDAYSRFQRWRGGKKVLLVTVGAFSDSWESTAKPVGLCMDDGSVVNRTPDDGMDGMVVVYNSGKITVVDLDTRYVTVNSDTGKLRLEPRESAVDRYKFLSWGQKNSITFFQAQLVYSMHRKANLTNLTFGNKRERRFLAICEKGGTTHHVVVDAPGDLELNLSASYAKGVLEYDGFTVSFIMNLETGGRDILHVYDGSGLKNLNPNPGNEEARIEKSTNLLVYYTE
ncbi:MAG: hypothetical protein EOO11_02125 [Chitinophagaceae bacterium]|nr:MAG: hypothetical protein EOO11_02125 [Chitinophagaceae bacterium]